MESSDEISQGPYNRSENGNIVCTESGNGISHSEIWERICQIKRFGPLKDNTAEVLNRDLIEQLSADAICLICLQKLRACAFRECGHLLVCQDCQHLFTSCPVCRKEIKSFVHLNTKLVHDICIETETETRDRIRIIWTFV